MKKLAFILGLAMLFAMLLPSVVLADTTPTTHAEFVAAYPSTSEQLYGMSNLGDIAAHSAPLTLGIYSYQLSSLGLYEPSGGLFADPVDVTTVNADEALVISFTGADLPKAVCLGVIMTDIVGTYLPGQPLLVSVNDGAWIPYMTAADFAGNAYIILEPDGISTIKLKRDTIDIIWPGISYMTVPSKYSQAAPSAPAVSSKTDTSVTLETIVGAEYKSGAGAWQASPEFSGLTPATEYTFYARMAETATMFASPDSTGTSVTTDKSAQAAPATPVVSSKTDSSVTLEVIAGAEYKCGEGPWQTSPDFSSLSPATEYTFYARLAETATLLASPDSTGTAVTTDMGTQAAPGAPSVLSKTNTSVTLETIAGAEYRIGSSDWQASPIFNGLSPITEYTFFARLAETATLLASPASAGTTVTTDMGTQSAPGAPVALSKTSTSVTLETIAGAEYRIGSGVWQTSPIFNGLSPATGYTFYARLVETTTLLASPSSAGTAVTTGMGTQSAPGAPAAAGRTGTTITLEAIPGAEYRMGDGAWQTSPSFSGLLPATEYTFYVRLAATTTALASDASVAQKVTTLPAISIPATGEHQSAWPLVVIMTLLLGAILARRRLARHHL